MSPLSSKKTLKQELFIWTKRKLDPFKKSSKSEMHSKQNSQFRKKQRLNKWTKMLSQSDPQPHLREDLSSRVSKKAIKTTQHHLSFTKLRSSLACPCTPRKFLRFARTQARLPLSKSRKTLRRSGSNLSSETRPTKLVWTRPSRTLRS